MHKKLIDYSLTAQSVIPIELCKAAIKDVNKSKKNWKQHIWNNRKTNHKINRSGNKELFNFYLENENSKKLMKITWNVIDQYVKNFNFNWFDSWQGHTQIRFNIYKKNLKMANHCDHIGSIFDGDRKGVPILSVLGVLNDNYEGGELIMFNNTQIKLNQGDMLVFPSNFLYPHRVEPVTKGTRYSFISWVW